jgi:hypothetical protein
MRFPAALVVLGLLAARLHAQPDDRLIVFPADEIEDKIRGGMLAQLIGNLNGLPHEFKYINRPGRVEQYTPSLPDGARTDDDTDVEWVYLREMARAGQPFLPPTRIAELWKTHINRRIWCANNYARQLIDLELLPPHTGSLALNPWAEFNISGQFVCESFGLMAPAMPQTAARVGLRYTRVAIDGEPAQATQLFTSMIATAFIESDLDRILDAGLAAVDPKSRIAQVVRQTRKICAAHPDDWQAARRQFKTRWQPQGGVVREKNGYELNTACTVAAFIYGQKDFVQTLRIAFNLGWDCDNNAATSATIVGVLRGRRWMNAQGWNIVDRYANATRDQMPMDETITGLENTLLACAQLVVKGQGGDVTDVEGQRVYRIPREAPANIFPLAATADAEKQLRDAWLPRLSKDIETPGPSRARAAYLAICLGEADRLERESPVAWQAAINELQAHRALVAEIFKNSAPAAQRIAEAAQLAGLAPLP